MELPFPSNSRPHRGARRVDQRPSVRLLMQKEFFPTKWAIVHQDLLLLKWTTKHKLFIGSWNPTPWALNHEPHNSDFVSRPTDDSAISSDLHILPDYSPACHFNLELLLNFGENLSLYCECVFVKPHLVKRKRHLLCICLCVCLGTGHTQPHKTVHNTRQFTLFYDFSKSRIGQSACFPTFILV